MCSPVGAGPHNEAMKGLFHLGLGLQSFSSLLFHGAPVTAGGDWFSYLPPDAEARSGYRHRRRAETHLQIFRYATVGPVLWLAKVKNPF